MGAWRGDPGDEGPGTFVRLLRSFPVLAERLVDVEAVELARTLAIGDLATYPAAHRRHRRVPNLFTEAALGLSRNPRLRRCALGALAGEPAQHAV